MMGDHDILIGLSLLEAEKLRDSNGKSWSIVETEGKLRGQRSLMDARIIRIIEYKEHMEILVSYF